MAKERLNLLIEEEIKQRMDQLKSDISGTSLTDVIRTGVSLLELVIEKEKEGGKFQFVDKDGERETLKILR